MEWYYYVILAVLTVVVIFAWVKSLKAGKKRRERIEKETARMKREVELRRDFKLLTDSIIENTPCDSLLAGTAMNIQIPLEKEADMTAAFNNLPIEKQYVYALEYFCEDCEVSLSNFLRCNGQPLIGIVPQALTLLGFSEVSSVVSRMLPMLDDDDETTSVNPEACDALDGEFKKVYNPAALKSAAADYIKNNKSIFINRED